MDDELTRRRILRIGGPALAGLVAGCSSDLLGGDSEQNDDWELTDNPPTETAQSTETATKTEEEPEPDTVTTFVGNCPDGCDCSTVMPQATEGGFTLWHNRTQAASQLFDGTKNMFNAMEGPTVKLQRIPSAFQEKLHQDIAAGQGPDAFQWAHDLMGEFVENEMLTDMSDQLRIDECMFTDRAWEAVQYDGGVYGLPVTMEAPALIYNQGALDDLGVEPPETIEEMKSIMDDWIDEGNDYGFAQPVDTYHVTWAAHMFGSAMYDGENLGLDDPEFAAGLRIILDELKPYMPTDGNYGAQTAAFRGGMAPFVITGPWEITGFIDDVDFNVGVTTIPDKTGHSEFSDGTARPYMSVRMLYFTSMLDSPDSQTAKAARDFVEWYTTSTERQLNLAENVGFLPAKSNLSGSDELPSKVQGFSKQTEEAILMPQNPRLAAVWAPYSDVLTQAWHQGTDSLEDNLQSAAEDIRSTWEEDY